MVDAEITGDCNTPPQDDIPCINDEVRKDDSDIEVLSQTFLQDEKEEMKIPPSTSIATSEKENHSTLASVLDAEVKSLQLDDVKSQQSDLPSLADSSEGTEELCLDSYSQSLSSTSKDKNVICDDDNAADSKIEEDPILSLKGHSLIGSSLETTHTSNVHEVTWKSKTEAVQGSEIVHTILSVDTTESVHASENLHASKNVHTCETAHTTDVIIHTSESAQPSGDIAPPDGAQEYDCSTACMLCVQDFLGCSEVGNEMLESKKDSSNSKEIDALESKEIAKMRKSIEYDLLTIMGCTGEGTNIWMNNLSETCEQWSCFAGSDDQPRDPFDLLETYEKTNDNQRKVQNRNVYIRDKAARRIRHLRSGGLSRTFTLAPVNNFLTEEFEDSCKDGKTIFSNSLGQPTPITCTKSAEYSWEHKSSRVTNGYAFKDFEGKKRFQTVLDFLNIFGDQSINRVSSDISKSPTTELYYDSDPEDDHEEMDASEMRKTLLPMKEVPEPRVASSDEGVVEEREKEGEEPRKLEGHDEGEVRDVQLEEQDESKRRIGPRTRQRSLLETFDVESTDMNDGAVVTTLIKELLNSGNLRFVWHPKSLVKSSITTNPSPVLVEAWIEMGSCLKSSLIQPKLIWREAHGMKDGGDRELNFQNPHQIDLLNIVRVLIPTSVSRETYPFVKLDCAFFIVSNCDNEYLFEAASREERDRFVHVFKVTVARLASKIIVGDKGVFSEFFSPWGRVKKGSRRQKKKRLSQKIKRTGKQTRAQTNKVYPNNFVSNAVQREGGRKDELWGDIS